MTYLEAVNSVLRRLREDTVTTVSENDYSALVGEFVNDAKRVVEDAWSWSTLLRYVDLPVVAGVAGTYDLEDYTTEDAEQFNERARLYVSSETGEHLAYCVSDNRERSIDVITRPVNFVNRQAAATDTTGGQITAIIVGTHAGAASGYSRLRFTTDPAISDTDETLRLYVINPQNALTSDSATILVPSDPVVQIAYLYTLYERGEELGEMLTLTTNKADLALADAIMHDSSMTAEVVLVAG
jgi:hypothetical protein